MASTDPGLVAHLFRTEFGRITAALCRSLGIEQLQAAEDIAADTFLAAFETWSYRGIPPNPEAWLHAVARNKARNLIKRDRLFREKIAGLIVSDEATDGAFDPWDHQFDDSQLRMLFAVCHPAIPEETQIALALRILCGFGIQEIADAFLTGSETISKRLQRGKEKLRSAGITLDLPSEKGLESRLDTVLTTLYLLFNEGYYSESNDRTLRRDLCLDAMRLTNMLLSEPSTARPEVCALLSLMCFHASRFDAREDASGMPVLYADQDDSRWNRDLIAQGAALLHRSASGDTLSKYHLEASIAYWHTVNSDTPVKWQAVLEAYDHLLALAPSPTAALNRIYAFSKVHETGAAIREASALGLEKNPFYHLMLADLHKDTDPSKCDTHMRLALALTETPNRRRQIEERIEAFSLLSVKAQSVQQE